MKKLFILTVLGTALLFQNCGTTEKKEKTETLNDSIVTETVIIDTVAATDTDTEIIVEDLPKATDKSTTVTKVTVKDPVKVVTKTTTETKVGENTKVEVVVKEQPTKTTEAPPVVKVIVQEPKVAPGNTSWAVPAKYLSMKNPTNPSVDLAIGKSLYTKHCKSCHGSEGYGDGSKAKEMKGDLGDFSTTKFQSQSDGALYYKTTFGRDDMPAFDKKISSDEDRWLVVNYMRTLKQ